MPLLLVFETHPIQYRAPIYQRINELFPDSIHVVYASDFSIRGSFDHEFNTTFAWDLDLLSGYSYTILSDSVKSSPTFFRDLGGQGVVSLIKKLKPDAILITSLRYEFDYTALIAAYILRIPLWLRTETQDTAFERSLIKSQLRSMYYSLIYRFFDRAFPIGILNRNHYLAHGFSPHQLKFARYATPNRFSNLTHAEKLASRMSVRNDLNIPDQHIAISFVGKLIPKKNPQLLLDTLHCIPKTLRNRICLLFIGTGYLSESLRQHAATLSQSYSVDIHFAGFVNQSELPNWYLATDITVLPSNKAGETWGLVVNESLQAGCSVIATEAVGCNIEFQHLPQFRTIPVGSAPLLAQALDELSIYKRDFNWATTFIAEHSIESAAQSLISQLVV